MEEKIAGEKERLELVKEMIRVELIEEGETEVERGDKILRLKPILKEFKNPSRKKNFEPDPDQQKFI